MALRPIYKTLTASSAKIENEQIPTLRRCCEWWMTTRVAWRYGRAHAFGQDVDRNTLDVSCRRIACDPWGDASSLPPIKVLRDWGVEVFTGHDDVRDTWSRSGWGKMLERMTLTPWRSGYHNDHYWLIGLDCATAAGKRIFVHADAGTASQATPDFFIVRVGLAVHAVARHSARNLVFEQGRIIARNEVYGA